MTQTRRACGTVFKDRRLAFLKRRVCVTEIRVAALELRRE